jgi:hypothetical protein
MKMVLIRMTGIKAKPAANLTAEATAKARFLKKLGSMMWKGTRIWATTNSVSKRRAAAKSPRVVADVQP